ncbi:50S ribosomal protein L18e [Candidatus Pacearchaeota archaeon]|jgi:large subunit ribosomal protein L18e|nr:50S ribosomal protein L18e [Candidatus Pacearchaeota archaeon]|tara:strand:+ start:1505 stop:1873 length:369 start_codon:yes stop_codon:yes gene_type:complete
MKSKTTINKQAKKKTNLKLVETIISAKKNDNWLNIARIISGPSKKRIDINLEKINEETKEGEIIVIPGKVLSDGEITKKLKIIALAFSEKAKEKILKSNSEYSYIIEEIKKNPEAKGIKIIK